jgi:hypothetical protein
MPPGKRRTPIFTIVDPPDREMLSPEWLQENSKIIARRPSEGWMSAPFWAFPLKRLARHGPRAGQDTDSTEISFFVEMLPLRATGLAETEEPVKALRIRCDERATNARP